MVNHNDVKILEINYRRPTLNDVFLHLTARELRDQLEETVPLPPRRGFRWRGWNEQRVQRIHGMVYRRLKRRVSSRSLVVSVIL